MDQQSDYSDDEEYVENCYDENGDQEEFEEVSDSDSNPDELDNDIDIEGDESDYIDECAVDISHFELIKKLGSGAYGNVFLVRKNCGSDADNVYALKVISKAQIVKVPKTVIHMKAERKALEILRHCPYIQKLYYAFQTSDKLFLVTEYLPGGEMFTQVQKGPLPEYKVRFYIAELIIALEHIHLNGIVYRDIKLENVLLDADGHVKLVDFGLCKKLGTRGRSKSFCGTEEYMAPEVIACIGHNSAADWWALGVLAIELLSTITPFGNRDGDNSILEKIANEEPIMPPNISDEMEDFLLKLLTKDPTERLGGSEALATQIKQHRLFSDIDWEKLENKLLPSPEIPRISSPTDTCHFSEEFTQQEPTYEPSDVPPNSFLIFKGYSYIDPELLPTPKKQRNDDLIDENWNSLTRSILSNRDPDSKFYQKYTFASHHPLGSGKSSVCIKCINVSDGKHYAVKIYKRQDQNHNEIDVLQKAAVKCLPGVLHLIEVLTDTKWTYLIVELIDGGISLLEYFSTMPLNEKIVFETFTALWEIVKSVHTLKYAHGRICFQNLCYLPSSSEFRLIGFGNAKPIDEAQHERIDYWSLGVCIYTVLCGHSPFNLLTGNETAGMINRIENDEFDRSTKQWSALHKDVKCFIEQLLCTPVPTCSREQLKKFRKHKKTSVRSVNWSKEKLDENKNIIEIRAAKAETVDVKVEMITVTNGVDVVDTTNGVDSLQIHDNDDQVHHSELKESRSKHTEVMNGHDEKSNTKRRNDQTDEQNGPNKPKAKKVKKDEVQPVETHKPILKVEEIKQERVLRTRPAKNYADTLKTQTSGKKVNKQTVRSASKTKAEPIEKVEDDNILMPKPKNSKIKETTTGRTKGRPKKGQSIEVAPVLPPKPKQTRTRAPIIPKQHSTVPHRPTTQQNEANTQDEDRWIVKIPLDINSASRYNAWTYNFPRPVITRLVYYCFERYNY